MKKEFISVIARVLALTLAVSALAACGSGSSGSSGSTSTVAAEVGSSSESSSGESTGSSKSSKDTLIIATANETPSLTSVDHDAVAGDYLNKMTYNCLFRQDEDMNVIPDLVESYEIESDTEWIFHLRQGVRFHNGEEMTADDVKASLELCKISPNVEQYGKSSGTIEVIDEYTVKITTDGPQANLLNDLCNHGNAILPADLIESGHDFNKEPIGTGPYVMTAWNKGESIEFEAFEDYFDGEAPIRYITWEIIPDGFSRTMALEAGEVDLLIEVETADSSRLEGENGITFYSGASTSHQYMMINNEIAPFDNIDFRKALNAAIDRNFAVQLAQNGEGMVTVCQLPECFPGVTDENGIGYDPDAAKAYMEASGLDPADCGFSIICSDDIKLRTGQAIQASLKEVLGIDVTLESMDLATYLDVTAAGDYEAAIGGYTTSDVLSYAAGVMHSDSINASNKARLNNPEVDALIDKALATVDPAENEEIITELSALLNDICPQVPLYLRDNVRAYKSDLKGFNINAGGTTYYEYFYWE